MGRRARRGAARRRAAVTPAGPGAAGPSPGLPAAVALPSCTGCGACVARCTARAIVLETELPGGFGAKRARVEPARCTGCGACVTACPHGAIVIRWP